MKERRYRGWAFILYPESAFDNWITILDDMHVPMAISPLHDLDVNEDTHELKKPHYHIIVTFDGMKSFDQVKEITDSVGGTIPIPVNCLYSYYRYLCHIDNQDKVRYDVSDIILLGGFDPKNYISEQVGVFVSEMVAFINQNNVTEYSDFVEYCAAEHPADWFRVLTDFKSVFFYNYIKSKRFKGVNLHLPPQDKP